MGKVATNRGFLTRLRGSRSRAQSGGGNLALALLISLAFSFQSIVVQSHVHFAAQASASIHADDARVSALDADHEARATPGHDHVPANNDPANCVICQQIALAGAAVLPPSLLPVRLQASQISTPPESGVESVHSVSSHAWRSRAPPVQI